MRYYSSVRGSWGQQPSTTTAEVPRLTWDETGASTGCANSDDGGVWRKVGDALVWLVVLAVSALVYGFVTENLWWLLLLFFVLPSLPAVLLGVGIGILLDRD